VVLTINGFICWFSYALDRKQGNNVLELVGKEKGVVCHGRGS